MSIERVPVSDVICTRRLRAISAERVLALAASIQQIGLRTPITVQVIAEFKGDDGRVMYGVPVLVAGLHRLEAAKHLGWEEIDAIVMDGDERDFRLWEIAENLHRADLTVAERAEHIAEWVRLTGEKQSAQLAPIESKRIDGRGHRAASGINAAVRELGIDRTEAQRAVKIERMAPEAKQVARDAGLDNNQSALLAAAKHAEPASQIQALREIAERKAVKPAPAPLNDIETEEQWMTAIMRVWNRGSQGWRERFLETVDRAVFDNTRAA